MGSKLGNLLTIRELADLLGVSKTHIYSLVAKDRIPYIKLSPKLLRFDRTEIERWIEERSTEERESSRVAG